MKSLTLSLVALLLTGAAAAAPEPATKVDLNKAFKAPLETKPLSKTEMKATKGAGECMTIFFDNGGVAEAFQVCW